MREMRTRQAFGLSGAALKRIAAASMLIDHIGAAVLEYGLFYQGGAESFAPLLASGWGDALWMLNRGLRMAGRLAFPLYTFLLVEGFYHTRSRGRYLGRLLLFAVLSEVPFDLAIANTWFYPAYQNVFFELAVCFLVLWGFDGAKKRLASAAPEGMLAVALAGAGAALLLHADYDVTGIVFVSLYDLFRRSRAGRTAAAALTGFWESIEASMGAGGLAAVPVWFYNGEKGRIDRPLLFYWFYPAHLLALTAVRVFVFGIAVR